MRSAIDYAALLNSIKPLATAKPAQNNKTCGACGRAAYLWGGETCDVCDSDNSGVNDRDEPIGSDAPASSKSLFDAPTKGFVVTGFTMERPLTTDLRYRPLYQRRAQRGLPL